MNGAPGHATHLLTALVIGAVLPTASAQPLKTLRYAFPEAETGFDPAQISDQYSRTVTAGIFEAPLRYDYLARPFKIRPLTATALPEVAADYRRFTFHIRPGIYFADDPAFRGRRRELTAQDYVYSVKRHYDPQWKSPSLYVLETAGLLGLSELRRQALAGGKPFAYDTEVAGLRALDRYTFEVRLAEASPRFVATTMADSSVFGAVAREVVEFYGADVSAHPVGTGPFLLREWRRSSRIVLARNPGFRAWYYDEEAAADDSRSRAIAATLRGRRLPMLDRVDITIVEDDQPRWLSFLTGEADVFERLSGRMVRLAMPNRQLAPNLARRGVSADVTSAMESSLMSFNLDHPVVGGYGAEKVALRRAILLAYRLPDDLRLNGSQSMPAQGLIPPGVYGHDPALKTEMSDYDPARANALLDMFGYLDRDRDGWREMPNGQPLTLEIATQPDPDSRMLAELWLKSLADVGVRVRFKTQRWGDNLKASRAGTLMMWAVSSIADTPDGDGFLALGYGPNKGQANHSRFDLPAYNALYLQQSRMADGPQRLAIMEKANKLSLAYAPYKVSGHRVITDLVHPGVVGYRSNVFVPEFWKYVDIDRMVPPGLVR